MSTKALREQRAGKAAKATGILTRAQSQGRNLTAEELGEFNRILADCERLKHDIDQREWFDGIRADYAERARPSEPTPTGRAIRAWMLASSPVPADANDEAAARQLGVNLGGQNLHIRLGQAPRRLAEARALTTTTITSGAALIAPSSFVASVESALLHYGGVRQAATVYRTPTGADFPLPTTNDTATEGEIVQESAQLNDADPSFGLVKLGAHLYSSKVIKVPLALARDAGFDLEPFLGEKLGERIGRVQAKHFTTGTGASQPQGIVTGATSSGVTTASASLITYGELTALEHSLDPAHRIGARFMASDDTIEGLKLLLDSSGRPIWQPGVAAGAPDTLNNRPFIVNQAMATGAGSKSLLFGDFSKYAIRDVEDLLLVRLNERYAERGLLAFLLYARTDAALVDAGSHPVKFLTMHA